MGGGEGAYGHDLSNNDAEGWKRSSAVWVEGTFRGGLRSYRGVDVAYDDQGRSKSTGKDRKHQAVRCLAAAASPPLPRRRCLAVALPPPLQPRRCRVGFAC
jgi:hypothetical protein